MNSFPYKGFGIILVNDESEIQKVSDIIKEIDDFEFGHMPKDMIQVDTGRNLMAYIGKFDLDLDELEKRCKEAGIGIEIQFETYSDHMEIPEDVFNPYE